MKNLQKIIGIIPELLTAFLFIITWFLGNQAWEMLEASFYPEAWVLFFLSAITCVAWIVNLSIASNKQTLRDTIITLLEELKKAQTKATKCSKNLSKLKGKIALKELKTKK